MRPYAEARGRVRRLTAAASSRCSKHVVTHHHVERTIGERQGASRPDHHCLVDARVLLHDGVDVDTDHPGTGFFEVCQMAAKWVGVVDHCPPALLRSQAPGRRAEAEPGPGCRTRPTRRRVSTPQLPPPDRSAKQCSPPPPPHSVRSSSAAENDTLRKHLPVRGSRNGLTGRADSSEWRSMRASFRGRCVGRRGAGK